MGGVRASFEVDTSSFMRALSAYTSKVDAKSQLDVVRAQLKFAVKGFIEATPFSTLAQGRQSVRNDLRKAVQPYGGEDGQFAGIRNEALRERMVQYSRRGEYDALRDIFYKLNSRGGFYSRMSFETFSPTLHHRAQNSRGRVLDEKMVVTPNVKEWKDYLRNLQNQVGRARGGWAASAEALNLTVPNWVSRHRAGGSYDERQEYGYLVITMTNASVFIPNYKQKIELALRIREKAMAVDLARMYSGAKTFAAL